LSFELGYNDRSTLTNTSSREFSARTGTGGFTYAITKGLGLRLAYGITQGVFGSGELRRRSQTTLIDAGLDFDKALSLTRRVTLAFTSGIVGLKIENRTQYRLIGNVALEREIGRTWSAEVSYGRSANMVETFRQPVFSDSVAAKFGGLINRRVQFRTSGGVAFGDIGLSESGNAFRSYSSDVGLVFAMTQLVAFDVDYRYYRYTFGSGIVRPLGLPQKADRQTLSGSVRLWLPLLNRRRRPDVTR
jgi:opacity protein-like surface antigen